ncbi:MAG: DUF5121 domain-containing protein [Bacteroidales bacterium]|nr:DUF5121 domain-containing protein [Bacteroidales bacterium]
MKKNLLIFAAVLVGLASTSCNKEKITVKAKGGNGSSTPVESTVVFSATMETPSGLPSAAAQAAVQTRTTLSGNKVNWVKGDPISILWVGGSAGATAASDGASSRFPVTGEVGESPWWGVYPGSVSASASASALSVTIPSSQSGTFAGANLMVAQTEDYTLNFKNLCGLVSFNIAGEDIGSVTIRSLNEGTKLTGTVSVTFDEDGLPVISEVTDGSNAVTVNTNGAGTYYVGLLPGITLSGFSLEMSKRDQSTALSFSDKTLMTARSKLVRLLGNIDDEGRISGEDVTITIDENNPFQVAEVAKGAHLDFTGDPDIASWMLDYDWFFTAGGKVYFKPLGGKYRIKADYAHRFLTAEQMHNDSETATFENDQALWVIGNDKFGKPYTFHSGWDPANGLCMAQVSSGVYQLTLTGGLMTRLTEPDLKVFGQKGWGTEFSHDAYDSFTDETGHFYLGDGSNSNDGNIQTYGQLNFGDTYQFELDFNTASGKPALTVRNLAREMNFAVNGTAMARSADGAAYTAESVSLSQNGDVSFTVNGHPIIGYMTGTGVGADWYHDPSYLDASAGEYALHAVSGHYRIGMDASRLYVPCQRTNADGGYPRIRGDSDRGVYLMSDEMAAFSLSTPIGWIDWDESWETQDHAYCLAEVSPMVFEFKGCAAAEASTAPGDRIRYDGFHFKYFGQKGYGWETGRMRIDSEWGDIDKSRVIFTSRAQELIHIAGEDGNTDIWNSTQLEEGATYVLRIDLSGEGETETIDFYKEE